MVIDSFDLIFLQESRIEAFCNHFSNSDLSKNIPMPEKAMIELKSRLIETELTPSVESIQSASSPSNAILFTRRTDGEQCHVNMSRESHKEGSQTLDEVFAVFDNSDTESAIAQRLSNFKVF